MDHNPNLNSNPNLNLYPIPNPNLNPKPNPNLKGKLRDFLQVCIQIPILLIRSIHKLRVVKIIHYIFQHISSKTK
jgi:hypothetical protein